MNSYNSIVSRLRELLAQKNPVLAAIDGYGGAGKTTLATQIQAEFPTSPIITLDAFATDTTTGADRIRFRTHVLEPLASRRTARYQPFNWKKRSLDDCWVEVKADGLVLIEGVSVLGEDFQHYYDLRIWMDCPFERAQERMKERERKAGREFSLSNYFNVWEKEDRDYGLTKPWERADIIIPA